jgi:hypothetical protein
LAGAKIEYKASVATDLGDVEPSMARRILSRIGGPFGAERRRKPGRSLRAVSPAIKDTCMSSANGGGYLVSSRYREDAERADLVRLRDQSLVDRPQVDALRVKSRAALGRQRTTAR